MVSKNQYVLGCFETVDDAIEVIKGLKERGCPNEDITLVTRENYAPIYAPKMDARLVTEEQVMEKSTDGTLEDESVWDKVKDAFAVETSGYTRKRGLDYRTDDDPLYGYQESLDQGGIVVMVTGDKWRREESKESELPVKANQEQAVLEASDAMRSNVITSTDKGSVMDSGLVPEHANETFLHDNESHTRGPF